MGSGCIGDGGLPFRGVGGRCGATGIRPPAAASGGSGGRARGRGDRAHHGRGHADFAGRAIAASLGLANVGGGNLGNANNGLGNIGNANLGNNNLGSGNFGSFNIGSANLGGNNIGIGNAGANNFGLANLGNLNTDSPMQASATSELRTPATTISATA